MPFTFKPCPLPGLVEVQPRVFGDDRGYFFESYAAREYAAGGIDLPFVQENQSRSMRGVLRGLHFQRRRPQGKLVRAVAGEIFDVAVDLRPGSPAWGKWHGVTLGGERQNQLYIPPGFAHGFLVLSETAVVAYQCTEYYDPGDEGGLRWDDPAIGIGWPDPGAGLRLSEKDRNLPLLAGLEGTLFAGLFSAGSRR